MRSQKREERGLTVVRKKRKVTERVIAVYQVREVANPDTFLIRVVGRNGKHYGWYTHNKRDELDAWQWATRELAAYAAYGAPAAKKWMWRWEDGIPEDLDTHYPLPEGWEEEEPNHG
jgi:hypothetical protein